MNDLGSQLYAARVKKGMTALELANSIGCSVTAIRQAESPNSVSPLGNQFLARAANVLECDLSTLTELKQALRERLREAPLPSFLRRRREELGISQREVAREIGWSHYCILESGFRRRVPRFCVAKLAKLMRVSTDELEALRLPAKRPRRRFVPKRKRFFQPSSEPNSPLGEFIRIRRRQLDLSQHELAARISVAQNAISNYEVGRLPEFSWEELLALARALECPLAKIEQLYKQSHHSARAEPTTPIGSLFRTKREEECLSCDEMAQLLSCSGHTILCIENGVIVTPLDSILWRFADLFGLDFDEVLATSDKRWKDYPNISELGRTIRHRCAQQGITQADLARIVDCSRERVRQIVTARRPSGSVELLTKIALALHMQPSELVSIRGKNKPAGRPRKTKIQAKSGRKRQPKLPNTSKPLSEYVQERRALVGLSQAAIDFAIGRANGYYATIEDGIICRPCQKTLDRLARALNCDPEELLRSAQRSVEIRAANR